MSAMRVVVCSIFVVIVGAKVIVADVVLSMSVVSCARHDIIYMESLQNYWQKVYQESQPFHRYADIFLLVKDPIWLNYILTKKNRHLSSRMLNTEAYFMYFILLVPRDIVHLKFIKSCGY